GVSLGIMGRQSAEADEGPVIGATPTHRLDATRLLRRASLVLLNRAPTSAEYDAVLAVDPADQRAFVDARIDDALQSAAFEDVLLGWGMETMRVISYDYKYDFVNTWFRGDYGLALQECAPGTMHAGAVGFLNQYPSYGEPLSMCDDAGAIVNDVEPWWEPGTTIEVIGAAGTDVRQVGGVDCGSTLGQGNHYQWPAPGCSCGPNMIYCQRRGLPDDDNKSAESARRQAFEEPARLYQHIIAGDRPFSDLVLGDYTVVTRGLFNLYRRAARRNAPNASLDDEQWFRDFQGNADWREVGFADMHPNLLADRSYRFDPRTDSGSPEGVPSAGVLSTIGANYAFPRERVRAARWIEIFACREFSPPPADVDFAPFESDPGTQGSCEHCHQLIDPAAMHFKRMHGGGVELGGVGSWDLDALDTDDTFRERSLSTFQPDTLMTPVDTITIENNPDASLMDFMPDEYSLFGEKSDGTIGPLGFGKILVESGEFDQCAVRRFHERVTGVELLPGRDDAKIEGLVAVFVDSDRNVKALIREIMSGPDFDIGW
ncbi:MAG: hypothetical protein AAF721_36070, partial [Myxococcota bacterium]